MSDSLAGRLLVASPLLTDPNFARGVVLVMQHDHDGAVGVILNRPSESPVTDHLPRWAPAAADPDVVFVGGPCEPEVAIGLTEGERVREPVGPPGLGVADLESDPEPGRRVRIFSGYAGWGPGQLESELEEEAWLVVDPEPADAFSSRPERLWRDVLARQPQQELRLLASYPPDPSLN